MDYALMVGTAADDLSPVPTPDGYQWGLQDISAADSGRVHDRDNTMYKMRTSQKRKLQLSWTDPSVADKLNKDYVLISLFVDDKRPLPEPIEVTEATGEKRTLRTIGDKWSYLQRYKFGSNTQPFYVCVDPQGNALSGSFSYKEDVPAFLDFLDGGLTKFKE
jgi:hypothetical protein